MNNIDRFFLIRGTRFSSGLHPKRSTPAGDETDRADARVEVDGRAFGGVGVVYSRGE